MKKEKVLALLLTAAMCATSAAPVSAADFSDETAETVAVEATEENPEVEAEDTESDVVSDAEETEPEVIADEAADDYEEGEVSVEADDVEAAGADVQELDFSDEITAEEEEETDEAGSVPIKGTVKADGGSISGVIPGRNNASYYKIDLSSAGGRLSLKGSSTEYMRYTIMDERENVIVRDYNDKNHTLDKSYELTQGIYLIKIYNESDSANGSFNIRTYFDTEGKTTFQENSNDTIYKASPISLGQKILGHTAINNTDDYYKIVIPEDGKYTFTYRTRTEGAGFQPFLYDSSLNEVEWAMPGDAGSCRWEVEKGTYYFRIKEGSFGAGYGRGFYDMVVTGHTHTFSSSTVDKATLTSNGSITGKCTDCGQTTTSTIYRPASIRLTTTAYTYNGKAKRPGVVVTDVNGRTIGSSSYTVSYDRDAVSAGKHKVTITFKGNYSGKVTRRYTINPKGTSISKLRKVKRGFKVKVRKQAAKTATGYQVQYCIRSNFRGAKTKTFRGTSFTVNRLKKKRVYYVRVRTYKKSGRRTYYSSWSAPKAVKTR
ncbi:hypothetical protein [Blautia sp. HCP28S3_G10]|uniref:fibronectin type III domain-containing protein n=1 Tax=Blautia sp. HCP28S3_G10 TaxID=3438908 RepID=UPI003F8887DC